MSTGTKLISVNFAVRWHDLDALNHVNNTSYLTYLEEARLLWLAQLTEPWCGPDVMPVLAAIEVNYRKPITWPANISVELYCERVGGSSVTIAHFIRGVDEVVHADGRATLVWVNPNDGKSVNLPAGIRTACEVNNQAHD